MPPAPVKGIPTPDIANKHLPSSTSAVTSRPRATARARNARRPSRRRTLAADPSDRLIGLLAATSRAARSAVVR